MKYVLIVGVIASWLAAGPAAATRAGPGPGRGVRKTGSRARLTPG
jgi:hypothetical protein